MYECDLAPHSRKHYTRGKAVSITHSECVSVALVTRHAMRMHRIVLSSVASLALTYIPTLSHRRNDFRENVTEHKMYVLIFATSFT